jgi:hypothetical protein
MAITNNNALRSVLSDAFAATFAGGTLEIRTAVGSTLLGTITLPNPCFGAASNGVSTKTGTWSVTAVATGVARQAVFISSDTLKTATLTVAESAADVIIDNEDIITGGTITVSTFTYTTPAS